MQAEYYSDDEEEEEEGRQGDKESEEGEETNERGAHQIVQSANKKRIRTMRWGVAWSFTKHGQSVSTACREGKVRASLWLIMPENDGFCRSQ